MSLTPGARLGPYEIVSLIGVGGMGQVWRAYDTRLRRTVAIKQMQSEHADRFMLEARAIALLNHPHVCTLYDVGPDYLVMEHLEGAPIEGPMDTEAARHVALQIAGALEAAHARGILHRDLKPGNVLMTAGGVKLVDFGLAKLAVDVDNPTIHTLAGAVFGTPAYMSPEQAQGRATDARSDIFSFGAVLYELLAGARAFRGESLLSTLDAVVRHDPPSLSSPLMPIVSRCLAKDPALRFQSTADLTAALRACAPGSVVSPAAQPPPSIAVLPFANLSSAPDDEYFSDGLADEIISALAKVSGLKVIARTSSFAFKGQRVDIRQIAQTLGVTLVLEGSVRRAGSRIRVTTQLVTALDGSQLWSERYDRQMDDLFAIQDEIAAAVAAELQLTIASHARPRRQPNLNAYEAFLRYRQYQWAFTPDALRRSRECLEQAIALDPEFALPYVGLADHHGATTLAGVPYAEAMERARGLAERALALDPGLPEAHGYLGMVVGAWDHDWAKAAHRFQQAMALAPVPWHVRAWYALFFLFPTGQLEATRREVERALVDNPLSQIVQWNVGIAMESLGRVAEARAALERTVELDSQFWLGWYQLALHHAVHGNTDLASEYGERARALFPVSPFVTGLLAGLAARRGQHDVAEIEIGRAAFGPQHARAIKGLVSGDIDAAVAATISALETRDPFIMWPWTFHRQLRVARRWPEVPAAIGLPAEWPVS